MLVDLEAVPRRHHALRSRVPGRLPSGCTPRHGFSSEWVGRDVDGMPLATCWDYVAPFQLSTSPPPATRHPPPATRHPPPATRTGNSARSSRLSTNPVAVHDARSHRRRPRCSQPSSLSRCSLPSSRAALAKGSRVAISASSAFVGPRGRRDRSSAGRRRCRRCLLRRCNRRCCRRERCRRECARIRTPSWPACRPGRPGWRAGGVPEVQREARGIGGLLVEDLLDHLGLYSGANVEPVHQVHVSGPAA